MNPHLLAIFAATRPQTLKGTASAAPAPRAGLGHLRAAAKH